MAEVPTLPSTSTDAVAPGKVPGTLAQVLKLARYQLRDYLRSRRFILMMSLVAIIGGVITVVVAHFRPAGVLADSAAFYRNLWGGGVTYVIIFAGVIFGADAIAGEFQNKTGYFLMGLPIRRVTVYSGKFLAALAASLTAVVAFALILAGNAAFYFGSGALTGAFGESLLLAVVYLLALLGATFLFSSLFKTSTYATLVVAVLFLFGFSILQVLVANLIKVEPWFLISYVAPVISYPFQAVLPQHVVNIRGGFGPGADLVVYNPTYAEGVAVMLGYFLLTTLAGLFLFEREEFT